MRQNKTFKQNALRTRCYFRKCQKHFKRSFKDNYRQFLRKTQYEKLLLKLINVTKNDFETLWRHCLTIHKCSHVFWFPKTSNIFWHTNKLSFYHILLFIISQILTCFYENVFCLCMTFFGIISKLNKFLGFLLLNWDFTSELFLYFAYKFCLLLKSMTRNNSKKITLVYIR